MKLFILLFALILTGCYSMEGDRYTISCPGKPPIETFAYKLNANMIDYWDADVRHVMRGDGCSIKSRTVIRKVSHLLPTNEWREISD